MKRLAIAVVAALAGLAAWAMPAPELAAGVVVELPEPSAGARATVWFCPGAEGEVDPILAAAVLSPGLVGFSLPGGGEILDSFQNRVGVGVSEWDLGDGLLFYPGPAIIESSTSPSAVAVIYRGPQQVAADGCYTAAKEWFLNGAAITASETLTLRLFNPLLEPARVSLEVVTEFGFEPLLDLETVTVGPRSWEDVSLSLLLGAREQVAVRVAIGEGVAIPSLHATGPSGLAVWPGESPSATWEFPLAQVAGTTGIISVWNPGSESTTVDIEVVGRQGPLGRFDLDLGPGREGRFDVSSVTTLEAGVVLRSSMAVVAAMRSDGPNAATASVGIPRPVEHWLVPGHNVVPDLASYVFVLNSGDDPVEVVAGPVGAGPGPPFTVEGHSLARLELAGRGADITAGGPISVAWLVTGTSDAGLALGVPTSP